jgi:Tfp pilus assembly protein PilE
MNRKNRSITLVELLISVTVVGVIILSFYSIDTFSRNQVVNSDRRTKLQNELSYALDHMGKYVQQGIGNNSSAANQGIQSTASGFRVRVDFNNPQTPLALTDDAWINYSLNSNNLTTSCTPIGAGTCGSFTAETFSGRIITFTPQVGDNGTTVNVYLVGRYDPAQAASQRNPQVEMRTKLICSSCSLN